MWHMYLVISASLFGCTLALKSTTGREFVTGFLGVLPQSILTLDIASNANGDVEVYIPYLNKYNFTYSFNRTFSITFTDSLQLYGTQIGHNGVYIKSSVDVSLYLTRSYHQRSSEDTHVCLPIQSAGREYYIASHTPNHGLLYPSLFMVISAFANTEVNISFPNGTSISKTLNWLDVYQEASPLSDLTGTIVQSSKPVSVVSGASCTNAGQGGSCDMIGEQMIPTSAFQTYFIIPPILSNQFRVRIFSSQSKNKVCVKNALLENCTTMGSHQWLESVSNNSTLVVTSQEPISVIQYKEDEAYMTTIPGIRQFMNAYTFVASAIYEVHHDHNNYISVTILSSASQYLRLDGKSPSNQLVDTAHVPPKFNNYTVLTFRVTAGYHVMTTTETHVVFGLIVFGIGTDSAYGYPAGINFDFDECSSNPCQNGNTCSNGVNGYICSCRAGVSGRNCDTDVNECASSPCLHGGTCLDGVNAYTCTCSAGFSGKNCEINIDECASSPCLHGGTCSDGVNAYTCACKYMHMNAGRNCEINVNECASEPCLYGGTCSDGVNAYTCTCSAGFTGENCEIIIDECASSPCLHGGTCFDGVNAYTCACMYPYMDAGRNCEINVNECASTPCLHGGTCSDGVNAYTCTCSAGFTGNNCEIRLPNSDVTCLNGGTSLGAVCLCTGRFAGERCQIDADCTFDMDTVCNWTNPRSVDNFDWVVHREATPTDDTGPENDHTRGTTNGAYVYIESSAPRIKDEKAWLQSPEFNPTGPQGLCLNFWYSMNGASIGQLNVFKGNGSAAELVWTLTGDQGTQWRPGMVKLVSQEKFVVTFEATVGNGYLGDIALDDFSFFTSYTCPHTPHEATSPPGILIGR